MRRRVSSRDWSIEEFDAWSAARKQERETVEIAAEEGGPRVTMVPTPHSVPLDFLPDAVAVPIPAPAPETTPAPGYTPPLRIVPADAHFPLVPVAPPAAAPVGQAIPFDPEPSRKTGGWSAERQRTFVATLAETGSVHLAARGAGLSARSAYALRVRSPAFARAWDAALSLAVGRLAALAMDRAIYGRVEQTYVEGELVAERRVPNDRLLLQLLARLDPARFAPPGQRPPGAPADPQLAAQQAFPALLGALTDTAEDWDALPPPDAIAPESPPPDSPPKV